MIEYALVASVDPCGSLLAEGIAECHYTGPQPVTLEGRQVAEIPANFAVHKGDYPLKNSVIVNPAITITVINKEKRLVNHRSALENDHIWSDNKASPILGYGTMVVKLGSRIMLLNNVAYCPDLLTILVSLRQLRRRGLYWNNAQDLTILRRKNNTLIAILLNKYSQFVIEYQPNNLPKATFAIYRKKYTSWTKKPPFKSDAIRWHYRIGHPKSDAFERFVNIIYGVKIYIYIDTP
jgi:hypothetical protein